MRSCGLFGKKGVSHVEIILAFVIFIAAVGFALYFFNPGDSDRLVGTSLTYAFREIKQNASVGVETFSVVIDDVAVVTGGSDTIAMNFPGVEGKTRVETYDGEVLNSSHVADIVNVNTDNWNGIDFLFVKFGEEFVETAGLSGTENATYYEIGSSNLKEVISEKRILNLKDAYDADYYSLRGEDNFNLPDRVNFGFSLVFDDGSIEAEREIPASLEVFSDTERVEVLRDGGEIVFADLMVKLW
ncbi:MAG: hypothetical protein KJ600_04640 [Nanoarchaeota archaeon]|nr:hypothetical protein [Nanoarchaeota archaeon]MBU1103816.1 hypothetical protein [Nanoarchaeota archaeon]